MRRGRPRKWNISKEVEQQLRAASKRAVEVRDKERLQAGLLAAQGILGLEEIAQAVGRARSCVQTWLGKLESDGVAGLLERGRAPGAAPALDAQQQEQLRAELKKGRHRTAEQIGQWIQQRWGVQLKKGALYYWLGKLEAVLRVPRPQHRQYDEQKAAEFRWKLRERLHELALPKDRPVRLWVQDEGRFGLQGFTRRVWTLPGTKPIVPMQQKYQWFYAFAALECTSGQMEVAYWDSVDLGITTRFLEQIAASDPGAEHVVIYDGAGFHPKRPIHELPAHVHVVVLPAYSPQLNPVEGLWDALRDQCCNQAFDTLEQLQERISARLHHYWQQPTRVQSLVHGWLQRITNASSPNIIPVFN